MLLQLVVEVFADPYDTDDIYNVFRTYVIYFSLSIVTLLYAQAPLDSTRPIILIGVKCSRSERGATVVYVSTSGWAW